MGCRGCGKAIRVRNNVNQNLTVKKPNGTSMNQYIQNKKLEESPDKPTSIQLPDGSYVWVRK